MESDGKPAGLAQSHTASVVKVFVWWPFTEQLTVMTDPRHRPSITSEAVPPVQVTT